MRKLILASKSPRRIELIQRLGIPFENLSRETDETFDKHLTPQENVIQTAYQKAKIIYDDFIDKTDIVVLGVDTVVVFEDKILTKPTDRADAFKTIKMLSGRTHSVLSGVSLISNNKTYSFCEKSSVDFMDLTDKEIESYLDTSEPYDKAGAYGIQGTGGLFVKGIKGCYYNIMGLPLNKLYCALRDEYDFHFEWK